MLADILFLYALYFSLLGFSWVWFVDFQTKFFTLCAFGTISSACGFYLGNMTFITLPVLHPEHYPVMGLTMLTALMVAFFVLSMLYFYAVELRDKKAVILDDYPVIALWYIGGLTIPLVMSVIMYKIFLTTV